MSSRIKWLELYLYLSTHTHANIAQQGMIRFIGNLTYWDYTDHQRPLVWARVWVCDRELNGLDYMLVERFTDTNGQFDSGWIVNNDGPGEDGLDIVFYFVAWNHAVQIIDPNNNRYYAIAGPYENMSDGQYNLEAEMPRGHGAWMIFSYHNGIAAGWNYLDSSVNYEMPMATVVWPYNTDNPFYDAEYETIVLPDWAAWYPEIILHEYAHYVMNMTYGYMPPAPSEYSLTGTSDNNTAWVEGWAFFFPLVVQNDPNFIDTNLEIPHWCSPNFDDGDEVVGRVAGALWDIYDSHHDKAPWYYDSFSNGFTNIWNIMNTTPCDTFYEFWQAWNTSGYPKQPALLAIFQNSIDYKGEGDVDADCTVDLNDVLLVANHFGNTKQYQSQGPWDDRRDLIHNDNIDLADYLTVTINYGKNYDC